MQDQEKKGTPLLSVSKIQLRKSNIEILDNLDWTVNPGEHWAVLGANGSGKTTLLSALTAYVTPTSGQIELFGHRYGQTEWEPLRKQIGIVSAALDRRIPDTELAVETVMSGLNAQLGYWDRNEADVSPALRRLSSLSISYLADRAWVELSQGERQKVFIARSLMARPKLLILDEPCAGLDPVARENFLSSISQLGSRKKGPGLILVTHHIEEIIPEITHVLLIKKGRTLASGPKREILTSQNLSNTFGARLRLRKSNKTQRYTLAL